MNFGLSEEQELLRQQVHKFLDSHSPMNEVRRAAESAHGYSHEVWRKMAELGWPGLLVPEAHGGAGLGWVDVAVLLEATGSGLLPSPLLSTILASSALVERANAEQQHRWLRRLASGEAVATVALFEPGRRLDAPDIGARAEPDGDGYIVHGDKSFVPDAARADLFVVALGTAEGPLLALVERGAEGVQAENHPLIDRTKRMGTLRLEHVRIDRASVLVPAPEAGAALERLRDAGAMATTAEMLGSAQAVHALTVDYAKQRHQFGQPIGKFQGVKHPLAEMHVDIETIRSLVYYAAWALDAEPANVPRTASMAKAYASDAFARIGTDCIQLHGAIGYTAEYDAQLYLKRSKWARAVFGDGAYHYDRIARLGGL